MKVRTRAVWSTIAGCAVCGGLVAELASEAISTGVATAVASARTQGPRGCIERGAPLVRMPEDAAFGLVVTPLRGDDDGRFTEEAFHQIDALFGAAPDRALEVALLDCELRADTGTGAAMREAVEALSADILAATGADVVAWGARSARGAEFRLNLTYADGTAAGAYSVDSATLPSDIGADVGALVAAKATDLGTLTREERGSYIAPLLDELLAVTTRLTAGMPATFGPAAGDVWNTHAGLLFRRAAFEQGRDSLDAAVAAYNAAIEAWPRAGHRADWARAQAGLAGALRAIGDREEGTESLEQAIRAYRLALEERPREEGSETWAWTQTQLGTALYTLSQRQSGTRHLEEAAAAFAAALEVQTRDESPAEWAATQNNYGVVLEKLGEREVGTQRLDAASAAFRSALEVWSREEVPLLWASAQDNLGNVLLDIHGRTGEPETLDASIAALRLSLEERDEDRVPLAWATSQHNLGGALRTRGGPEALADAAEAYGAALRVFDRETHAVNWGLSNLGLATVIMSRAVDAGRLADMADAHGPYAAAEEIFTREDFPEQWGTIKQHIGYGYFLIYGQTRNPADLDVAERTMRAALAAYREAGAVSQVSNVEGLLARIDAARPAE